MFLRYQKKSSRKILWTVRHGKYWLMLFIYLYHGDLYSDLWKSDLFFSPVTWWFHRCQVRLTIVIFDLIIVSRTPPPKTLSHTLKSHNFSPKYLVESFFKRNQQYKRNMTFRWFHGSNRVYFLLLIMITWSHRNVKFLLYRWFCLKMYFQIYSYHNPSCC